MAVLKFVVKVVLPLLLVTFGVLSFWTALVSDKAEIEKAIVLAIGVLSIVKAYDTYHDDDL